MRTPKVHIRLIGYGLLSFHLLLSSSFLALTGCGVKRTVADTYKKTTKTVSNTTREFTRSFKLSDEDLLRRVGIINFENFSLGETNEFQNIFHKGLPGYLNQNCEGILVDDPETGRLLTMINKPPRLKSGYLDNYSLALLGRQLGLNAIVTGSLEDIRVKDEVEGVWITKDTHHFVEVIIRVEINDSRTASKLLDYKFTKEVEIEDIDYQMIKQDERIHLPMLNETLNQLLAEIGKEICLTVKDQPWTGFITDVAQDRFTISSGSTIGLKVGDVLEVFDSKRIIEGVGGQRFITPGLKIGEIEILTITPDTSEARLVSGKDIIKGSTVRRK